MPNVEQSEYFEALKNPLNGLDSVDAKILSNQRKEQNFLRKQLFKNKLYEKCSICGETFPISFLCCSHIKKKMYVLIRRKKDYKNIVVTMCKFGCDELYEKGYISVKMEKLLQ